MNINNITDLVIAVFFFFPSIMLIGLGIWMALDGKQFAIAATYFLCNGIFFFIAWICAITDLIHHLK